MEFHAVEARFPRSKRGLREKPRKFQRQIADVRLSGIRDALALADLKSLKFPLGENGLQSFVVQTQELLAYL